MTIRWGHTDLLDLFAQVFGPDDLISIARYQDPETGRNALHEASFFSRESVFHFLLTLIPRQALDELIKLKDKNGQTALDLCSGPSLRHLLESTLCSSTEHPHK